MKAYGKILKQDDKCPRSNAYRCKYKHLKKKNIQL